ncbi:uncharacterized protein C05D11.1-like [Actinia tenebrosa]|uniref:Uncharacterized protein C05D11.1-like n=1 Tax=Actinia tenebrosa TaxID=6105 RepID=A0A6P8HX83_ACTTE|nr:uncharacterized protein C05D11.1-like [Actinia tenebrosa]
MAANFESISSFTVLDYIPIKKYRSKRTGIQFCFAQVPGPLVNGYLCLATEAHDDDGLPHTLEHLVFMGSEDYPYKGLLDLLANRCLAQGTNAWTATDYTCYTIETAGSEGFINLLPIYLDHVLYATLTESAYVTEVHHVNGEGEDAGVVYCEMQARENSGRSRTHLKLLRNLYPGHCGLKSETGGIMANLRTSCSHQKVCDYHRQFYRPENLCVIITGMVDPDKVFEAITPFEDKILSKGSLPPYTRPWQDPIPPLPSSVNISIQFPTEDETSVMVLVGTRGPGSNDRHGLAAVHVIMDYLTDTSIAPLQQHLVEIPEPYCGDVGYDLIEHPQSCLYIMADNVAAEKLTATKDKIHEVLREIASGREIIDMGRMASVINRLILDAKDKIENDSHHTFADFMIFDFLYSKSNDQLESRTKLITELENLACESADYWAKLVKQYFVTAPVVTVIGEPSDQLMKTMAAEEKQRVEEQKKRLGDEGLAEKAKRLKTASDDNEIPAPVEVVSSIPVPSTSSIHFHPIKTFSNRHCCNSAKADQEASTCLFPVQEIPFAFQLDHVMTMFVEITALFDTSVLPDDLKPYLSLFLEVLFESPLTRDGTLVPYEQVVAELTADTLGYSACIGVKGSRFMPGNFEQLATIKFKVEAEKYERGVKWLHDILFNTVITKERLDIVAKKMINEVASMKREGRVVTKTLLHSILFSKDSNLFTANMIRQHVLLTKIVEELDTNPKMVIDKVEALRNVLTKLSNIRVHVAADAKKLPSNAGDVWKATFSAETSAVTIPTSLPSVPSTSTFITKPLVHGKIVGVGSVESSYLTQVSPCINTYDHEDLASIMVYLECLITLEGPIWRQVRGLGLSYSYSMRVDPGQGSLIFMLARSTHLVKAYEKTKEIVDGYLSGQTLFDSSDLEAAISSVIFGIINREKSVSSTAYQSMIAPFRNVGSGYNRNLLERVSKVTIHDLDRVGQKYIAPLFDPLTSRCAVCCHPSKVEEIREGLGKLNKDLIVVSSLEEEFKW